MLAAWIGELCLALGSLASETSFTPLLCGQLQSTSIHRWVAPVQRLGSCKSQVWWKAKWWNSSRSSISPCKSSWNSSENHKFLGGALTARLLAEWVDGWSELILIFIVHIDSCSHDILHHSGDYYGCSHHHQWAFTTGAFHRYGDIHWLSLVPNYTHHGLPEPQIYRMIDLGFQGGESGRWWSHQLHSDDLWESGGCKSFGMENPAMLWMQFMALLVWNPWESVSFIGGLSIYEGPMSCSITLYEYVWIPPGLAG